MIQVELDNIKAEEVYELVNPSVEKINNLLGNKIILFHKHGHTGEIEHYKAQFAAQGDLQCESIDYELLSTSICQWVSNSLDCGG